jgi:hypothetical protein
MNDGSKERGRRSTEVEGASGKSGFDIRGFFDEFSALENEKSFASGMRTNREH